MAKQTPAHTTVLFSTEPLALLTLDDFRVQEIFIVVRMHRQAGRVSRAEYDATGPWGTRSAVGTRYCSRGTRAQGPNSVPCGVLAP
jgi:hypothetical protein